MTCGVCDVGFARVVVLRRTRDVNETLYDLRFFGRSSCFVYQITACVPVGNLYNSVGLLVTSVQKRFASPGVSRSNPVPG